MVIVRYFQMRYFRDLALPNYPKSDAIGTKGAWQHYAELSFPYLPLEVTTHFKTHPCLFFASK